MSTLLGIALLLAALVVAWSYAAGYVFDFADRKRAGRGPAPDSDWFFDAVS